LKKLLFFFIFFTKIMSGKNRLGHLKRDEVFDEVDEFHLQTDKIMLETGPLAVKSDHELSDVSEVEDIQGLDPSSSEHEEETEQGFGLEEYLQQKASQKLIADYKAIPKANAWGVNSKDFFNQVEQRIGGNFDLEKAVEEQEQNEALRKLRLQGAVEADFVDVELAHTKAVLDPEGWAEDEAKKRAKRLAALPEEERSGLISKTSAELPGLLNEFKVVISKISEIEKFQKRLDDPNEVHVVKMKNSSGGKNSLRKYRRAAAFLHRTATAYSGCLAFYLNLQVQGVLVRNHPVFERIVAYKTAFWKLEGDTIENLEKLFRGEAEIVKKKKKRKRKKVKDVAPTEMDVTEEAPELKKRAKGEKPTDKEWEAAMGHYRDALPEDGRRVATRQILKNKGLMRYRKYAYRHSRLKIRARHAKKEKARQYRFKPFKETKHNYDGEYTGIRTNLTKSAKFNYQRSS